MFRRGQKVKLSPEALENYGEEYRDKVYKIEQWYDHQVSSQHYYFHADEHGHPGYDGDATTGKLYHLAGFPSDLYDLELEKA
jgi:hypothetical protein